MPITCFYVYLCFLRSENIAKFEVLERIAWGDFLGSSKNISFLFLILLAVLLLNLSPLTMINLIPMAG